MQISSNGIDDEHEILTIDLRSGVLGEDVRIFLAPRGMILVAITMRMHAWESSSKLLRYIVVTIGSFHLQFWLLNCQS